MKITHVEGYGEDTQQANRMLTERIEKLGLKQDQIINIVREVDEESGESRITLFLFYWAK